MQGCFLHKPIDGPPKSHFPAALTRVYVRPEPFGFSCDQLRDRSSICSAGGIWGDRISAEHRASDQRALAQATFPSPAHQHKIQSNNSSANSNNCFSSSTFQDSYAIDRHVSARSQANYSQFSQHFK